jgi:hypothetical protein
VATARSAATNTARLAIMNPGVIFFIAAAL